MKVRKIALVACSFLLLVTSVFADEATRPKIALVLGGGGARGAAHIGVLKVLEECRVPIDFVVGTSMGSIVGGLYASGMDSAGIEETINGIDWVEMFKDRPNEEYLSFRNKKDLQRLASIEMGVKDGKVALPFGAMAGQKLGFALKKFTLPVRDVTDFDKLAIPFRAVATNLRNGDRVVLKSGNLAEAMRASMSIPGVWPPVEREGLILVDGFLVDNVPVDVAKELGAQIIIAVDVGASPSDTEKFESLLDVVGQMTAILSQQNVDKSRAVLTDADVLINPKLAGITTSSFTSMPAAIKEGEQVARAVIDKIKRYSVSEAEYATFKAMHRTPKFVEETIDEIRISGLKRVSEPQVRGRMKTQVGKQLDAQLLQQDITRIFAMGDFESVDFRVQVEKGQNVLEIIPKEKPFGPNFLRFGLNLAGDTGGANEFTTLVDYRMTQLNRLGAEWKNVLQFGGTRGIFSDWYQPLDTHDYFFAVPFAKAYENRVDVYQGNTRIATYKKKYMGGGVGAGVNFKSYAQARVDYLAGVINAKPDTGGQTLPEFKKTNEGALKFTLDFDQLDNHKFPKQGIKSVVNLYDSAHSLGGDYSYKKLDATFMKVTSPRPRHTVLAAATVGTSLSNKIPYYDQYSLGGFMNLSGYSEHQLVGQHKGLGQLLYYYKLGKDPLGSGGNVYLGGGVEYGTVWNKWSDTKMNDLLLSGLLFVGVDTPLGPLYLGYAQAEKNSDGHVYLYLGKTF